LRKILGVSSNRDDSEQIPLNNPKERTNRNITGGISEKGGRRVIVKIKKQINL